MTRSLRAVCAALIVTLAVGAGLAAAGTSRKQADQLSGAGATFPALLIGKWTQEYEQATGNKITYNAIGSGGGIAAITSRQVDFGASDAPLTPDQFAQCKGCVQIPWVLSSTSVPYNLPGAPPHLRITGKLLADMYLGKITRWNDTRLKNLNKGVDLPETKITPIFRSDASGTTFNFTDYLSKVSPEWKRKVGNSTQVNFPTGVGAPRSSGVDAALRRTEGGITYVDIAYALKAHFNYFRVQNKAGVFQLPGIRAIQAAAKTVKKIPANNELSIVDPPKSQAAAYPICTFSYVLLPLKTDKAAALKRWVSWALTKGQSYGPPFLFVPVPKLVQAKAQSTLKRIHG